VDGVQDTCSFKRSYTCKLRWRNGARGPLFCKHTGSLHLI